MAAFRGMHVSPAEHSSAWLRRKCDYQTDRRWTVIPMYCFAGDTKGDAPCLCLAANQAMAGYKRFYDITSFIIIPPATKLGGVYWNHPVRPSVCPSVCRRARLGKIARLGIGCRGGYFVPLGQPHSSLKCQLGEESVISSWSCVIKKILWNCWT